MPTTRDSSSRPSTPRTPPIHIEDEDDSFSSDLEHNANSPDLRTLTSRTPFVASTSSPSNQNQNLLYPSPHTPTRNSNNPSSSNASQCSTASATPLQSRSSSPQPLYLRSSSSSSDDSGDEHPFLPNDSNRRIMLGRERPRWWTIGERSRKRRRREAMSWLRSSKRMVRRVIRHPFVPKTPVTITLSLLLLTAFGISLTLLLMYILNPDKEPLPWRGYCTIPQLSEKPPLPSIPPTASFPHHPPANFTPPTFPPDNFDSLSPAGVFLGVFSIDTGIERRMLVRSTYASHYRSRNGAGDGDDGMGTSRTIVRFILGQPRKDWERRIQLEQDTYNDIVILPISENMNSGKSHAFFTWAASNAWVPPIYLNNTAVPDNLSYANQSSSIPPLAKHDPIQARHNKLSDSPLPWVRPDFVLKADDDAFVMLAELEARLRVALHAPREDVLVDTKNSSVTLQSYHLEAATSTEEITHSPSTTSISLSQASSEPNFTDPLIYWGYRVKNRFMAGELYGLSYSLTQWVAKDPEVKTLTRGAEDKQTSKWMRLHPRAQEVRWVSERCWIYDHPRAGTVYSHGFLFPSEVNRVHRDVLFDLEHNAALLDNKTSSTGVAPFSPFGPYGTWPTTWTRSTVSIFGVRYSLPIPDLTADQSIEALVEGSEMSLLREGTSSPGTIHHAWENRQGRIKRYNQQRLGGTVAVHFIKKNMWFLETALAMLEGDDVTEVEREKEKQESLPPTKKAVPLDPHSRTSVDIP